MLSARTAATRRSWQASRERSPAAPRHVPLAGSPMDERTATALARLITLTPGPVYLVGGSVRDLVAGTEIIKDIDLVMASGSEDVARAFAGLIGGSFFVLDEERKITRVVKRGPDGMLQFDFTN